MKKFIMTTISLAGFALSSFATANTIMGDKSHAYAVSYGYGSTHYVKPYTRRDGTYVEGHRAGNPGSGVHCQNNVCY